MSAKPQSTALATRAPSQALAVPSSQPARTIEQLSAALTEMQQTANVLTPVAAVDHIMPLHQVSLRVVRIDSTVDQYGTGPECYRDPRFCDRERGEVALGKNALGKIMAAGGVQQISKTRLDDRSDPYYCEIEVTLALRDFDGTYRQVIATKELDLREGAPETLKPEKDAQHRKTGRLVPYDATALADKRRHIQSLCETKAIERGVRLLFSLKQKYTAAELAKPFVVPKLVAALDPSDPEQKAALINHALGAQTALFGPPPVPHRTATLRAAGGDYDEAPAALAAGPVAGVNPVLAGQLDLPLAAPAAEPDFPPDEDAEPLEAACGLPVTEATLKAIPVNDEPRMRYLSALVAWCVAAEKRLGSKAADALFAKLGAGFDPLASPLTEISAVVAAIKAEIGGGK